MTSLSSAFGYPIWISDEIYDVSPLEISHIRGITQSYNEGSGGNKISQCDDLLENKSLIGIKSYITHQLNRYFHDILKVVNETELYITQSWANFNEKDQGHHKHYHSNSVVSAVFYVQTDGTPIKFYNPKQLFPLDFCYTEYNMLNSMYLNYQTAPGNLIVFPSTLEHSVPPNETDLERISIAVNTFVKGKIGHFHGKYGLEL